MLPGTAYRSRIRALDAAATPTAAPSVVDIYARADVNHDGGVNVVDVVKVAFHIGPWWRYDAKYDVNLDGRVNARDLLHVIACLDRFPFGKHRGRF